MFGFVTKHACDGQTNGQNYDSLYGASIAARAVKIIQNTAKLSTDKHAQATSKSVNKFNYIIAGLMA